MPNGILTHVYAPSCVINARRGYVDSETGMLWNPAFMSIYVKTVYPYRQSMVALTLGKGKSGN